MDQPTVRHRTRRNAAVAHANATPEPRRRVFSIQVSPTEESVHVKALREYKEREQLADPFEQSYSLALAGGGAASIIQPPYNPYSLIRLPQENSVLAQCIAAVVTNVDAHGYRLEYTGPEPEQGSDPDTTGENSPEAKAERIMLENLINFPNDDHSFQELRERVRTDKYSLGWGVFEVGRDTKGRVTMMAHVPAHTVRMTGRDNDFTQVQVKLPRDQGKLELVTVRKRFRRFVQLVGNRKVYFKEFGDPRKIDPNTGLANDALDWRDSATELVYVGHYTPHNSPYSLPPWINQLPNIIGSRQAEMVNLNFFRDNAIPAMMLLVSGGQLTQGTIDALEENLLGGKGAGAMNRILIVEAEGDATAAASDGTIPAPRIDLKPLANDRQKDQLFGEYINANHDTVRSALRLPPILIGNSKDYTYATAKTSLEMGENQVFGPERAKWDDMMDLKLLSTWEPKFWRFRSNPPRLTDPDEILKALDTFEKIGAMTPNIAVGIANEMFDLKIPPISHVWGDWPFEIVKALATRRELTGIEEIAVMDVLQEDYTAHDLDKAASLADIATEHHETGSLGAGQPGAAPAAAPAKGKPKPAPAKGKPKGKPKPANKMEAGVYQMIARHARELREAVLKAASE